MRLLRHLEAHDPHPGRGPVPTLSGYWKKAIKKGSEGTRSDVNGKAPLAEREVRAAGLID